MQGELLPLVEAAYRMDVAEGSWLEGLAEAAGTALAGTTGVFAWTFREGDVAECEVSAARGLPLTQLQPILRSVRETLRAAPSGRSGSSGLSFLGALPFEPLAAEAADAPGASQLVRHVVFACAADESGRGVGVLGRVPRRVRISAATSTRWESVMRQVLRAHALRRLLGHAPSVTDAREHSPMPAAPAAPPAPERQTRRQDAVQADHATGTVGDPARRAWEAVLDGRWAVLDRFDLDGRAYLLARPVPAERVEHHRLGGIDARLLALRAAGAPLKVIADALGLSVSAVSRRLERAMRALGLRTASELAELFAPAGAAPVA